MKINSKGIKTSFAIISLIVILFAACSSSRENPVPTASEQTTEESTGDFVTRLNETGLGLVREVPALDIEPYKAYIVESFTKMETDEADVRWLNCVEDLTAEQQNKLSANVPNITFNSDTIFPDSMPAGYDPSAILEAGKNPGLGVRSLHSEGITGSGVGIAIIDQTLYTGHPEYSSQLALYEEIHVIPDEEVSMHGSAVSSIAVGKNCGVAPGAKLYYWAVNFSKDINNMSGEDADIAFANGLAVAVDRVLEVNKSLPKNEKIRVISISRGFSELEDEGVQAFLAAVERAKKAGIFVITTSTDQYYDWLSEENDFAGLGKVDYTGDPDKLSTYTLGTWELSNADNYISKLLVPMDARTTADFTQGDGYVFYSEGGFSWVAPYLAGVYALACQVKPDITPEKFWNIALNTADTLTVKIQTENNSTKNAEGEQYTFQYVINPVRLIESLEDGK